MDAERAHQRPAGLELAPATHLEGDELDALVACYRLLMAIARREGVIVTLGDGATDEERAVGT